MARSSFVLTIKLFLFGMFLLSLIETISPLFTNITTDQSALLALKAHITDDPQNILSSNWSISTSVCNWVGVTCGLRHQRVRVLNFSYFGLTGTIPPHIGNLSFLTELHFRNNSFHGSLPIELIRLHRLKLINFGYNDFTGEIPSWFGSFSKLEEFYLYGNQFSGSIPKEIGNATMLKILWLSENHLTAEIPHEIGNIELEELIIHSNTLSGIIPSVIFNISSLKVLTLYSNNFYGGVLPHNLCLTLPNLEELYLNNCQLHGLIPAQFPQCKKLRILDLGTNDLAGSIPSNLFNVSNLVTLWLEFNNFEPTILPDNICQNLPKLVSLGMSDCNLGGRIPTQFSQCGKLSVIGLSVNNFVGSIPQTIGNLTNLEVLYLDNNRLTEYGLEGYVSTRRDVYSYGILLMETFTGKKPIDAMFVRELSLKKWVEDAYTHHNVIDVADANFLEGMNLIAVKDCLSSIFKLALCCTTESPIERKNMRVVSFELNKVKQKFLKDIQRRSLTIKPSIKKRLMN